MKKIINAILFFLCFGLSLNAMDVSISYATFKSPEQNFIEIYLHFAGKTVEFVPVTDSTYQANVEVLILFRQGEQIVKFDKFSLSSPLFARPQDFIDQKRYGLDDGRYELIVRVKDLNAPDSIKEFETSFEMQYNGMALEQSDLQLLASFHKADEKGGFIKNGIYMEPLPYNFYGKNASSLSFYNEIYNADQAIGEDFLVSYSVSEVINGESKVVLIGHKRKRAEPVIPILMQLDISELASGNYILSVEVRDRTKELLSKKSIFFQRSNPYYQKELLELADVDLNAEFVSGLNPEQLEYSLRALTPKMPPADVELVNAMLKRDSIRAQRLYLFSYWVEESPNNPEFAYRKYMEVVDAIEKQFRSGFRYGFETDRGYIYLKYGAPDDIERRENESSAPPYEIWSYYEFPRTNQNNVKFVFYNPSLAPGDYVLLHSTAIGELNNPQWQRDLYRDAPNEIDGDYFEGTDMMDNFNRNAKRVFRDY